MTPQQRAARFAANKLLDIKVDEARRKRPGSVLLVQDLEAAWIDGMCYGMTLREQPKLLPEPTEWR